MEWVGKHIYLVCTYNPNNPKSYSNLTKLPLRLGNGWIITLIILHGYYYISLSLTDSGLIRLLTKQMPLPMVYLLVIILWLLEKTRMNSYSTNDS